MHLHLAIIAHLAFSQVLVLQKSGPDLCIASSGPMFATYSIAT